VNRLAGATSPYLRQHADNPVDWYPWGEEAFAAARASDRPILLSVGYSSCHWCHVMAHESFEDPVVAALMNRGFVNVKVDREERPDVDAIYMTAVQTLTGRGGWPMTVFLDHDGRPFYAGTYFPPDDRHGMPGFPRVLETLSKFWRDDRKTVRDQATALLSAVEQVARAGVGDGNGQLSPSTLEQAAVRAVGQYDHHFGGFGAAPKFPQAMTIDFLLRAYVRRPEPAVLEAITGSLDGMAAGGLHDQVGGGFHRYSVDAHWLVPHFEKMLYDQALLGGAYLRAWMVTDDDRYRAVVEGVVDYVLRDLRQPDGGFYSAEDADSEGIEGKFYLWALAELRALLGDDAEETIRYFGVTEAGNFVDPHTNYRGNILHAVDRTEPRPAAVQRAIPVLLAYRARRVRPGLDDKVLCAWNALFLRTLVEAAVAFERDDWLEAARANAQFLRTRMRGPDGRWLRSWQGGRAAIPAFAEDLGALLEAFCTIAELVDVTWLDRARRVADQLIEHFADPAGGVFTTADDAERLIVRPKDVQDNATPAENSLAANGLLRLAALTGERRYAEFAERWLRAVAPLLGEHPTSFAHLLGALDRAVHPPLEVAVVGHPRDPRTLALRRVVTRQLWPGLVSCCAPPGVGIGTTPLLSGRSPRDDQPTAYLCRGYTCDRPTTEESELRAQVRGAYWLPEEG